MPPNNKNKVRTLIGKIKLYEDMWSRLSHLLQPLYALASYKIVFKKTDIEDKSFEEIKCIFNCDRLSS